MPAAGIFITAAELHALAGLPHPARALYPALRARMDYRTAIVGAPTGISWQALVEDLYVEPGRGEMPGGGPWRSPERESVRRIMGWLVRAGLVQLRSNANQAQLLFYLPHAQTLSRAQKKPDRNPTGLPDRGRSETLSTETRPTQKAETRQTSGKEGKAHQAAAATVSDLEIDPATLIYPPGTSTAQQRAYGAIARKCQLDREQLQLLLDEMAGKGRNGAIRNGAALLDTMARQLRAGDFHGSNADRERGGGSGLSADEARMLNEGGIS